MRRLPDCSTVRLGCSLHRYARQTLDTGTSRDCRPPCSLDGSQLCLIQRAKHGAEGATNSSPLFFGIVAGCQRFVKGPYVRVISLSKQQQELPEAWSSAVQQLQRRRDSQDAPVWLAALRQGGQCTTELLCGLQQCSIVQRRYLIPWRIHAGSLGRGP